MYNQPDTDAARDNWGSQILQVEKMVVRILIARTITNGGLPAVLELIAAMRREAQAQPGYIGGETLDALPHSREVLVLSTWQSIEHWNQWFEHPARLRLQKQMNGHLIGRTEYTIYRDF